MTPDSCDGTDELHSPVCLERAYNLALLVTALVCTTNRSIARLTRCFRSLRQGLTSNLYFWQWKLARKDTRMPKSFRVDAYISFDCGNDVFLRHERT